MPCNAGTYQPIINASSSAQCLACPSGSYCVGGLPSAVPCPTNTNSVQSSSSLFNCICLPGYQCTYTKTISLVITLSNVSISAWNSNTNNITTNLKAAIAAAAHVSLSQVTFVNATLHINSGSSRRLLGLDLGHASHHHQIMHHHKKENVAAYSMQVLTPKLDVHSVIVGAHTLSNLNHHLIKYKVQHHGWRETPISSQNKSKK